METGIRELRNHLSKYLAAVRAGEEVVVTDHGKAFARLVSLEQRRPIDRLIAEGVVTPASSTRQKLTAAEIIGKGTVSDLVASQRK